MEVIETVVLSMASTKNIDLVVYEAGGVESPGAGEVSFGFQFGPGEGVDVIGPYIANIVGVLSPHDKQVGEFEFCGVVGALPGRGLVLEGAELDPVVVAEVEDADGVESLLIGSASSKEKKLIVDVIVAESAI